jgi:hypothetical protein
MVSNKHFHDSFQTMFAIVCSLCSPTSSLVSKFHCDTSFTERYIKLLTAFQLFINITHLIAENKEVHYLNYCKRPCKDYQAAKQT